MNDAFAQLAALEDRFQAPTYERFPLAAARGSGAWLETVGGGEFLDFYGGHAVTATGHCHPRVVEAIRKQAGELLFYSNLVYNETRARAAEALIGIAPEGMEQVFFVNSGSEANEAAMRIARKISGKRRILSFEGGFHGRTAAALSACGIERYRAMAAPAVPFHDILPFGDLEAVRAAFAAGDVAAVLLEPIQSMAGIVEAAPEFYVGLRALTQTHASFLIYDEVQTGLGRTGTWFYSGNHGVVPDLVTLGKALGSGVPIAAVLMSRKTSAHLAVGDLGSTFGGGPLACAALLATVQVMRDEKLPELAQVCGARLRAVLCELPWVEAVRGTGLLLGLRTTIPAKRAQKAFLARGILTGTSSDPHVMRLLPPLALAPGDVEHFLAAAVALSSEL